MSRGAYPKYKPSGIDWLGEIPEHWKALPLKRLGKLQAGAGFPDNEQGLADEALPFYKVSDANTEGNEIFMRVHNNSVSGDTAARLKSFVFPAETLIFAKVGAALLLNKRRILTRPSCIDNNLMGFMRRNCDLRWIYYWMCYLDLGKIANPGAVPSVNEGQVREIAVPVPRPDEQRAIAAFLDRETGRIDALMEKKQRQIELLQEKRAALISHAVTKGLDPTVKMKDSGVDWLGHVPTHWEPKKLKFVAKIQTGLTLGKDYKDVATISRPYMRVANVQDGYLDLNDITEVFIPEGDTKRHELKQGDVLMTEGGDFDKLGRGYVWEDQIQGCLHQNHIFAVRPNPKYLASRYLAMLMTSSYGKAYFTSTSQQTTNLATTNITKLKNILLPLPNIQEQGLLIDWLGQNVFKIDALSAKIQESIDRLKEYRTALISAAVTGKIDVREAGT